jgi:pilus assembly protein CpaE
MSTNSNTNDDFWLDDPMAPPTERVSDKASGLDSFPDLPSPDPIDFDVPPPPFDEPMEQTFVPPAQVERARAPTDVAYEESDIAGATYWSDPNAIAAPEAARADTSRGGEQPVPRISIHAFCDRGEVMEVIKAAQTDRRLAKAHLTVSPGGLEAANRHFANEPSPNLLILDSTLPYHQLLGALDQLATFVEPGTKVILIGAQDNIQLFKEVMRRGVSEYLVPPLPPLDLIKSISQLYVDPDRPFVGRQLAFIGAKGGVGSSTVAHNIAWLIAERYEANTTLVDLDLSFGTVGLDFNQDSEQGVLDALRSPDRVDDAILDRLLTQHSEHLNLFTAPGSLVPADFTNDIYEAVLNQVRRGVPFVAVDLPNQWTSWVQDTVKNSDDVIITATPDLAALRGAKQMVEFVRSTRPNDRPPILVLNQVGVPKKPEIPIRDFANHVGIEPSLVLPFDPAVFVAAAHNGQVVSDCAFESKAGEGFDDLARRISGRSPVERKVGFMDRVRQKLNKK